MNNFLIDEYNGYKQGERFEKRLYFVKMYGNAKTRYVELKDENNVKLVWTTTDYNKTFQNFKTKGVYKFTIDFINNNQKEVHIFYMRLTDKKVG
jgi:hypothetical protein